MSYIAKYYLLYIKNPHFVEFECERAIYMPHLNQHHGMRASYQWNRPTNESFLPFGLPLERECK